MSDFTVHGPLQVPVHQGRAARVVRAREGTEFFSAHPAFQLRKGVYVFAMRSGGGISPVYVGSATKGFGEECFEPHKLGKCNEALSDYLRGSLVLFLICADTGKGAPPSNQILLVEDFFIQAGIAVNPDLLNVKGTLQATWRVNGVIRNTRGKPSKAAQLLKQTFRL